LLEDVSYVDAPELFYRVEGDDFLKEVVPVVVAFAAWRFCEPKSPCVGQRVLDVEIVRVVEDGDNVAVVALDVDVTGSGREGDGV